MHRLAICGHGTCGKDTVSHWLVANTWLQYAQSTSEAAAALVFSKIGEKYGYPDVAACFADRHQHREEWAKLIWEYNQPDGLTLYRDMAEANDIYNGIRRAGELRAAIHAGLIDLTIWVERDVPIDPSNEIRASDCHLVLFNNDSLESLYATLRGLARFAGLLRRSDG